MTKIMSKRLSITLQVDLKPKGQYSIYSRIQSSDGKGSRIKVSDFISSFENEVHTNLSNLVKEEVDMYRE